MDVVNEFDDQKFALFPAAAMKVLAFCQLHIAFSPALSKPVEFTAFRSDSHERQMSEPV